MDKYVRMRDEGMPKQSFDISGKHITVYTCEQPDRPIIFLNTFEGDGEKLYQILVNMNCPDFTLVEISNLAWEHDMTPWDIPPLSPKDTPCTGGADEYLKILVEEIVPRAEELTPGNILWRGLAGYSLAGLFAVYSLYRRDVFSRISSMFGSFWFPGFMEYVTSHELTKLPEHVYFSLGDMESQTKNSYFKTVKEKTEKIKSLYEKQNIDTFFQLNPGNHHTNVIQRTADGILCILNQ